MNRPRKMSSPPTDLWPADELALLPEMKKTNWEGFGDSATKGRRYQLSVMRFNGEGLLDLDVWVIHCGHPTALWPYYIEAFFADDIIVSPNGHGFRYLEDAKLGAWKAYWEHVEGR